MKLLNTVPSQSNVINQSFKVNDTKTRLLNVGENAWEGWKSDRRKQKHLLKTPTRRTAMKLNLIKLERTLTQTETMKVLCNFLSTILLA